MQDVLIPRAKPARKGFKRLGVKVTESFTIFYGILYIKLFNGILTVLRLATTAIINSSSVLQPPMPDLFIIVLCTFCNFAAFATGLVVWYTENRRAIHYFLIADVLSLVLHICRNLSLMIYQQNDSYGWTSIAGVAAACDVIILVQGSKIHDHLVRCEEDKLNPKRGTYLSTEFARRLENPFLAAFLGVAYICLELGCVNVISAISSSNLGAQTDAYFLNYWMTFPNPIEGYLLFVLGISALVAFHMENFRLIIWSSVQACQQVVSHKDLLPVFYVYESVMLIIFGIGSVQGVLIARLISKHKRDELEKRNISLINKDSVI